jgi:hypothetical protein
MRIPCQVSLIYLCTVKEQYSVLSAKIQWFFSTFTPFCHILIKKTMKKTFEIKSKKMLNSLIRDGKFYAKNESNRILNFSEKDPLASCWGIMLDKQPENSIVLQ